MCFYKKKIGLKTAVEKNCFEFLYPNKENQSWTKYQFDYLNI